MIKMLSNINWKSHIKDIIFIIIVIAVIIFFFIKSIPENEKVNYEEKLNKLYQMNPNAFKFDSNNTAIIKVRDIFKTFTQTDGSYYKIPHESFYNDNQDECVGYIVVRILDGKFIYDYSHACDLVDY